MLMKTCYHNKSIRNIGNIRDLFILISFRTCLLPPVGDLATGGRDAVHAAAAASAETR